MNLVHKYCFDPLRNEHEVNDEPPNTLSDYVEEVESLAETEHNTSKGDVSRPQMDIDGAKSVHNISVVLVEPPDLATNPNQLHLDYMENLPPEGRNQKGKEKLDPNEKNACQTRSKQKNQSSGRGRYSK